MHWCEMEEEEKKPRLGAIFCFIVVRVGQCHFGHHVKRMIIRKKTSWQW